MNFIFNNKKNGKEEEEEKENMSDEDCDIDNSWVNDYINIEQKYESFYKIVPLTIKIFYIYINSKKIISLTEDTLLLNNNGVLEKDIIISIIQNKEINKNFKYKLISILKYNIDIEPELINKIFIDEYIDKNNKYCSVIKNITNIKVNNTIGILHDINSLFFIFEEDNIIENQNIKSIIISHNKTKKKKCYKKKNIGKTRVKRT